jgi:Ca2+-binding RTX toxin-like protein
MATIRFESGMPDFGWFEDFYNAPSLGLKTKSTTKAAFEDKNGAEIVLTGNGLAFKSGEITAGVVTGVQLLDEDGAKLISVSKDSYSGKSLSGYINDANLWGLMTELTEGDDKFIGGKGSDSLNFGDNNGNDTMIGGVGGDYIAGSRGDDVLIGGDGKDEFDTLSYEETYWRSDDRKGVALNTKTGIVTDCWGDTDKIEGFEELRGSVYADKMTGSAKDESFMGMEGNDVLDGGGGKDTLRYHRDDRFDGHKGIVADLSKGTVKDGFGDIDTVKNFEEVYGAYHNDTFVGDGKNNMFRGISGTDSFDGKGGVDEISFRWWEDLKQHGAIVDLSKSKGQIIDDGFGNTETVKNIEAVGGSQFADKITLGVSNGWAWGDDGNDRLTAGVGQQWFGGGAGADRFVFASFNALGNGASARDFIDDFSHSQGDRIDLQGVGDLFFKGKGAFSGAEGELRYTASSDNTLLSIDLDGDRKTDVQIMLGGKIALVASDFIL